GAGGGGTGGGGAEEGQAGGGVKGGRLPDRSATVHPGGRLLWIRIVGRRPRVAADVARRGNRVEAPDFVAILRVERGDSSANAVLSARNAGEDQPVVVAIRAGQAVTVFVVLELRSPGQLAGLLVERDKAPIEHARKD